MKALCTWLFICLTPIKAFPQYLLCNEIPLQYRPDSISFGKSDMPELGDSVMVIPISNLSDTTYYEVEAKLVAATPLPGGTTLTNAIQWQAFAQAMLPGQTADARFYFKVDSLIPPEFKTSFRLWVTDPVKRVFDSCVFADFVTENLNAQIVPELLYADGNYDVRIYPVPVTDVLHIIFTGQRSQDVTMSVNDISGKKIMEQKTNTSYRDMDVSSLTPGIYFLTINYGQDLRSIQFSVIR